MNDQYRILYSPKAVDDLKDIYSYIAHELMVPNTAKNQTDRIRKEIRSPDVMPSRHTIVDWEPWKSMKMHIIPVDNFNVYYTVSTDTCTVTIIRIVYKGRDIKKIADSSKI